MKVKFHLPGLRYNYPLNMMFLSLLKTQPQYFREGVEITTESNLLTMVTCIGGRPNNRYLVQGVLVNPPMIEKEK